MLNRENYQEYFGLYADNELDKTGKLQVESFINANQDLQAEFEGLLATRLIAQLENFEPKTLLYKYAVANNMQEALLLKLDGELKAEEDLLVNTEINNNPVILQDWMSLTATRLIPEEIEYPGKQGLYRKTTPSIFLWYWMAAAVVVGIIASVLVVLYYENNEVVPTIAIINAPLQKRTAPAPSLQPGLPETGIATSLNPRPRDTKNKSQREILPAVKPVHQLKEPEGEQLVKAEPEPESPNINVSLNKKVIAVQQSLTITKKPTPVIDTEIKYDLESFGKLASNETVPGSDHIFYLPEETVTQSRLGKWVKKAREAIDKKTRLTSHSLQVGNVEIVIN